MKNRQAGKVIGFMLAGALVAAGFSPALAVADGQTVSGETVVVTEAPEILAVYVNTEKGSDSADGTSASSAVKTTAQAAALLSQKTSSAAKVQKYIVYVNLKKGEIKGEAGIPGDATGVTIAAFDAVLANLTRKEESPVPTETPKADEVQNSEQTEVPSQTEEASPEEEASEAPAEEIAEAPAEESPSEDGDAEAAAGETEETVTEAETETSSEEGSAEGEETKADDAEAEGAETGSTESESTESGSTESESTESVDAGSEETGSEESENKEAEDKDTDEKEAETEEPASGENTSSEQDEAESGEASEAETEISADNQMPAASEMPEAVDKGVIPTLPILYGSFTLPVEKEEEEKILPLPAEAALQQKEADALFATIEAGINLQSDEEDTRTAAIGQPQAAVRSIGGITIIGPGNYDGGSQTASGNETKPGNTGNSGNNSSSGNKGGSTGSQSQSNNNKPNRTNTTKTESTIRTEAVKTGDAAMILPLAISSMVSAAVLVLLAYLQTQAKRYESALAWRRFRQEHPLNSDFDDSELDF